MADILIRGMEMPKDCPHCEFAAIGYASPMSSGCTLYCRAVDNFKDCATEILKDKPYEVISHYNDRPDWCPLVHLPEGHGRLIDADRLAKRLKDFVDWCRDDRRKGAFFVMDCPLPDSPTIVPAEGGTEDGNCS